MVPRFFVSSTYYDLKHVRERLEKFIENYGFEPILFESDKVTYQHGKEIDQSVYFEVGLCHVMVLIVGGRYGSPSSKEKIEEERRLYDDDYISITRKEFETASAKNIPILIFVDKNVYSEFQTYKENQDFFDSLYLNEPLELFEKTKFKFAHVDHVNIFKFIDLIRTKPIKTFEKVEEIESYIKSQLSGMFYLYLESLKNLSDDNKILDTISELNNITLRMDTMLNSVGKQILGEGKLEYEKVIDNQLEILMDFFSEKLYDNISFYSTVDQKTFKNIDFNTAAEIIYNQVLKANLPIPSPDLKGKDFTLKNREMNNQFVDELQTELLKVSEHLKIKKINIRHLNGEFRKKVLPFLRNIADEQKIIFRLQVFLEYQLDEDLPF